MPAIRKASSLTITIALTICLLACSKGVAGTYVHQKNTKEYMELREDGTFFVRERSMGISGKYRVDGDVLTLMLDAGPSSQGKIHGNTIIDGDGESWVKQPR
jgi:hypothetical protein